LEKQLALIKPRVVVALGNFAAKLLLKTDTGISRLRGRRFPFGGATLIPTFHPAAALRGGAAAEGIGEDFEEIRRALDEAPQPQAAPEEPPGEQLGLF
jgi:DNA polymerase